MYGVLFPNKQEAGFSNIRLWESVGFTVAFAYSNFLCVWVKLAVLATVLVFGVGFYYIIEMKECMQLRRDRDRQRDDATTASQDQDLGRS